MSSNGLTLTIDSMDNAAFADNPREEVARILRAVADQVAKDYDEGVIRDINGNKVGAWGMTLPEVPTESDRGG